MYKTGKEKKVGVRGRLGAGGREAMTLPQPLFWFHIDGRVRRTRSRRAQAMKHVLGPWPHAVLIRAGLLMVARGKPVHSPHLFGEACFRGHRDLPRGLAGVDEDPEPNLYGRFYF